MGDSLALGATNLTGSGDGDTFIADYDGLGNLVWAKGFGGTGSDVSGELALDAASNTYLSGIFQSTNMTIGSTTLIRQSTNSDAGDGFVAKFDSSGNPIWVRQIVGIQYYYKPALAVDAGGNIYVTGNFLGKATLGVFVLTNIDGQDIFVAKYDPAGNELWARQAGGISQAESFSVAVDAEGGSYIAGSFFGDTISFGGISLTNHGGFGNEDLFVAKYDTNGFVSWARPRRNCEPDCDLMADEFRGFSFGKLDGPFFEERLAGNYECARGCRCSTYGNE